MNLLSLAVLAAAVAAPQADSRGIAESAMRKALVSGASWRMEKTLSGASRTLVASGTVECRIPGGGIEWRTLKPFESSVKMLPQAMVFEDVDSVRTNSAASMPRYLDVRKAVDAFASGNDAAFNDVFDVKVDGAPGGKWRAVFTPVRKELSAMFGRVEVSGGEYPETVVMESGTAVVKIRFSREADGGR